MIKLVRCAKKLQMRENDIMEVDRGLTNSPQYKEMKVHLNAGGALLLLFFFLINMQFPLRHPSL